MRFAISNERRVTSHEDPRYETIHTLKQVSQAEGMRSQHPKTVGEEKRGSLQRRNLLSVEVLWLFSTKALLLAFSIFCFCSVCLCLRRGGTGFSVSQPNFSMIQSTLTAYSLCYCHVVLDCGVCIAEDVHTGKQSVQSS